MGALHTIFEEVACKCLVNAEAPYFGEKIMSVTFEPWVLSGEYRSSEKIKKVGDLCLHTKHHDIYVEIVHKNPLSKVKFEKYTNANIDSLVCVIEAESVNDVFSPEYYTRFLRNKHNYHIISKATPFEIFYNGEKLVFEEPDDRDAYFCFTDSNTNVEYMFVKKNNLSSCEKRIIKRQSNGKVLIQIPGYDYHKLIKENLAISNNAISFQ